MKNGVTFKTVESVQDMILLSSYIDVIRSTFGIPTSEELNGQPLSPLYRNKLRNLILNNLPLLYSGIQNIITRCSKYYGSEFTKQVEDENIKLLFQAVGVQKKPSNYDFLIGSGDAQKKIRLTGRVMNMDPARLAEQLRNQ
jgi:hypothetical protein